MAKGKKTVYNVIIALCIVVFAVCAFFLGRELWQYKVGRDEYSELTQYATGDDALNREIDWEELRKLNPDIVGWIYLPDTVIDYPVVQGQNNEYYLTHTFQANDNKLGAIFMDFANDPDLTDDNTIIYGHHMRDGSMFKTLVEYKSQEFYEEHPTVYYYSPGKVYECPIFSTFVSEAEDPYTTLMMGLERESMMQKLQSRSGVSTDVTLDYKNDNILTLSTCTYDFNDARYVVQCKIIDRTNDRT